MELDEYLIAHRNLSLDDAIERYAEMTKRDPHDIDTQLWRERESRNSRYREIDEW